MAVLPSFDALLRDGEHLARLQEVVQGEAVGGGERLRVDAVRFCDTVPGVAVDHRVFDGRGRLGSGGRDCGRRGGGRGRRFGGGVGGRGGGRGQGGEASLSQR